jgi:uncharacterized lipoprotein YbaY
MNALLDRDALVAYLLSLPENTKLTISLYDADLDDHVTYPLRENHILARESAGIPFLRFGNHD